MTAPQTSGYVFADTANLSDHHGDLVTHLGTVLDPFTARRLLPHLHRTARCLEIGAGAGTIAAWLADQLDPDGHVIATDVDPQHITANADNLTVRKHDIASDPIDGTYDLIHARLLLAHLPNRYQVLDKLANALSPGGVLVIDEFAAGGWDRCVLDTPDPDAHRLFAAYHEALVAVMESAGTDTSWGRDVHTVMRRAGLIGVETELWARSWRGGEAGCLLPYTASAQLRPKLLQAGMSSEDLDAFRSLLLDPELVIHNSLAISTTGESPAGSGKP